MSDSFWISFSEEQYICYKDAQNVPELRWEMIKSFCPAGGQFVEESYRVKIVYELFSQALEFCVANDIVFTAAEILFKILQAELSFLANLDPQTLEFSFQEPQDATYLRFSENLRKFNSSVSVSVRDAKLIGKFFTSNFARNLEAYQYVLQNAPTERAVSIKLEVATPFIFSPSG